MLDGPRDLARRLRIECVRKVEWRRAGQQRATLYRAEVPGTRDLQGTLQSDGAFQIAATPAIVHGSIPAVDTFADGRFTAAGFSVRNTTALEATPTSGPCTTVVLWEGAKQGAPNVIP